MKKFDLLNSPLQGHNLIEASAGTGKTYTIVGLYLRLLLEKEFSVDQILVVTFTVAAMDELRCRIRRRIKDAIEALTTSNSKDHFLIELVEKIKDRKRAQIVLTNALHCFDEACIFTIHGFCQRILQDKAFECGARFETDFITEQNDLLQEIAEDFWRIHMYSSSAGFVAFLKGKGWGPDSFTALASQALNKTNICIVPPINVSQVDSSELETLCDNLFQSVKKNWSAVHKEIEGLLLSSEGLKRNLYKPAGIKKWLIELDHYLMAGNLFPSFDKLNKFGTTALEKATKKGHTPIRHSFFDLCDELDKLLHSLEAFFERRLIALKREFLLFAKDELTKRKKKGNVLTFDDLLQFVWRALQKDTGPLAMSIRAKYKAALIDEFQDTDPLQYAIFKKIYPHKKNLFFLIGDPKQAIYSFRGADIFTYMQAAGDAENKYTLEKNWRSIPSLIAAINTIFSSREKPFFYENIHFLPVSSAQQNKESIVDPGCNEKKAPFQLWVEEQKEGEKLKSKAEIEEKAIVAVAEEITHLLSEEGGPVKIEGRAIEPSDIAVLVRTNRQAQIIQHALRKRNIPSVLYSSETLFASTEAEEFFTILAAIAEPSKEERIRAALATELFGFSAHDLLQVVGDERAWEVLLDKFQDYHMLWARQGFMVMARAFLTQESIRSKLLMYPDGVRRVTNLLHCVELLHRAVSEHQLGIGGLLKWFARQLTECPKSEEHQIRLETDEKAVKLVTIHKSKGLEYSIVFCPFCWSSSQGGNKNGALFFHDPRNNNRATIDLGTEEYDTHKSLAQQENLAEDLRLLYVAMTRAKVRCYLVWAVTKGFENSALAYLFSCGNHEQLDALKKDSPGCCVSGNGELMEKLKKMIKSADQSFNISALPEATDRAYNRSYRDFSTFSCQTLSRHITIDWSLTSYSSLVAGGHKNLEILGGDEKDYSENEQIFEQPVGDEKKLPMIDFPRGAKAGTCLHTILEKIDYIEKDFSLIEKVVQEELLFYGFDGNWSDALCRMIKDLFALPLKGKGENFCLASIAKEKRITEMEFYFPIGKINSRQVGEIFSTYGDTAVNENFAEMIKKLNFSSIQGLLKGYIDLIFQKADRYYIADWKSNYLGIQLQDYGKQKIREVMISEYYLFQAYLYTIALHKYLSRNLIGYDYEKHFGCVFYVFLRGIDPSGNPEYGIFRHRPPFPLITALDQYLSKQ